MAQPVNQEPNFITEFVFLFGATSTVGALAGWTFNLIDPIGGAIFGAVHLITLAASRVLLDYIFDDSAKGKALKNVFSFFASIAASTFVTTLAGYTITVMSGIGLSIAMLAVLFAVACLAKCCPCLKPLLGIDDDEAQPEGNPQPGVDLQDGEEGQPEGNPQFAFNGEGFRIGFNGQAFRINLPQ